MGLVITKEEELFPKREEKNKKEEIIEAKRERNIL